MNDDIQSFALRQIVGNDISSFLSSFAEANPNFHYSKLDNSGSTIFRFSSLILEEAFPKAKEEKGGIFHTDKNAMFFLRNEIDNIIVELFVSSIAVESCLNKNLDPISNAEIVYSEKDDAYRISSWDMLSLSSSIDPLEMVDYFVNHILPEYEKTLASWIKEQDDFVEGGIISTKFDRYERNPKARQACIDKYGAKCAICGFDFGLTYGEEFKGMIEVHHIIPISSFGKEHQVDPLTDLIPVCPNCHAALHKKKGQIPYLPDELREFLKK